MFEIESLPKGLFLKKNAPLLTGMMRGVEREALRTDMNGTMASTEHPQRLGSALTHPQITTDFSESLLEFITPPTHSVDDLFNQLYATHRFTLSQLDNELLWTSSMPCAIGQDGNIPVARYGSSNIGRMKTVYRVGLGHRYGRAMQAVSGVHYNFSLPNAFWAFLSQHQNSLSDLQDFKDEGYFNLIRNFRRNYWLLIYVFGASPALCKSFVSSKNHALQNIDENTLHLPFATSLRMGDLGYQSSAQESLYVCYNTKASYVKSLCGAITTPHPAYQEIGIKDDRGLYKQLNTSLLQIENEFYSSVRPKRTAKSGETALSALQNRGVEYIEVRCLDVNPFESVGLSREQVYFLDTFLLYCALQSSPQTSREETARILRNQKRVVNNGREPGLQLDDLSGGKIDLKFWGLGLLAGMRSAAELLDAANQCEHHQSALELQKEKLLDAGKTPSARILNTLKEGELSYSDYALDLSKRHCAALVEQPLDAAIMKRMADMAEESLAEQQAIEEQESSDFDSFIVEYYQQYKSCRKI
ncbi:MAG: glutamate--cysteine ligase [Lentisphaeria bacterium]|jgi:glutamate--cysteine ligase